MARFEFSGIDDVIADLENISSIPLTCNCSACGREFEIMESEALQEFITCPHCGARLEEF